MGDLSRRGFELSCGRLAAGGFANSVGEKREIHQDLEHAQQEPPPIDGLQLRELSQSSTHLTPWIGLLRYVPVYVGMLCTPAQDYAKHSRKPLRKVTTPTRCLCA